MPERIVVRQYGGPDVLRLEAFEPPAPGPGEVLVRMQGAAVNFLDVHRRSGRSPTSLPLTLGSDAMGRVEALGPGASGVEEGQRVGLFLGHGGYSSHIIAKLGQVVPLPDHVSDDAASSLSRGLTAWMLAERLTPSVTDKTVLVHAAAGGIGSILAPWLKSRGAIVIAHSGSPEKAAIAEAGGADHSLTGPVDELAARVRALTAGRGVDIVYDGVGAATWDASLASVAARGLLVSFGGSSGPVPPLDPMQLGQAGSVFMTRPRFSDYIAGPADRRLGLDRLFSQLEHGHVAMAARHRFRLEDACEAHRALEGRQTTGPTILIP